MKERLKNIFSDKFIIEVYDIDMAISFKEYDIDSLDFVEFMLMIEDEFDMEISDKDAENLKNLGDVLKYLENVKD
jgi:acyl carrier protein